jgi:AcrR family transcriptional regulator
VARAGADASLEEIARRAGVGAATLHRHFPSRQTLLEAVFHDRVVALCDRAHELAARSTAGPASTSVGAGPASTSVGAGPASTSVGAGPASTSVGAGPASTSVGAGRADASDDAAGRALADWLRELAAYGATTRGLAKSLLGGAPDTTASSCEALLIEAGEELLRPAQAAGAVRPEVTIVDLLTLVNAVSLATEASPDAGAEAARLATLALDGVRPRP